MSQLTLPNRSSKFDNLIHGNLFRFLAYVKPYKYMVMAATIGGIVKFTIPLLVPQVTQHLVDDVYLSETLTTSQKTHELLLYTIGMAALFAFFWAPWTFIRHYYAGKAGHQSVFDVRYDLYRRVLRMSASFFDRNKSGGIVSRIISDIELAQNLVGTALTNIWMDVTAIVLILFFLVRIDLELTIVSLISFPIYIYFFRRLNGKIRTTSHRVQEEIEVISGNIQERITGNRIVHAFVQENNEQQHFHQDSNRLLDMSMHRVFLQSLNVTVTGVIVNISPLFVMLYGGHRVITGELSVGELVAVTAYLAQLYNPLQRFSELNLVFSNSMAAIDRVFEVMDEKPEVRDTPKAIKLEKIEGRVSFENVNFAYHNTEEPGSILENINLTVEPGEKIALVGPSGAGKSTLASLLPRFYDVDSGHVRVDGYDVRDLKLKSLRSHIGLVLQTPILFSGSIWENVRYGKPNATDDEIIAACKAANAYDFIMQFPQGFNTQVGEGGTFLSGGQRQRITIARAFLKDPKILILDEATSALDNVSERLIQESLEKLMENRTTFIVAHRLTTIENADRIIVMNQGRIVETGKHTELVKAGGLYEWLYS